MEESKSISIVATSNEIMQAGIISIINANPDMKVAATANNDVDLVRLVHEIWPDILILDIDLPKIGAIELSRNIKKLYPPVAILLLTNRTTKDCLIDALKTGVAGYLLKSVSANQLTNAIRALCSGEAVISPNIVYDFARHLRYTGTEVNLDEIMEPLTQREKEILNLASQGLRNKNIAESLFISERTVQSHLATIFKKFRVGSRTEAVLWAFQNKYLTSNELP